MLVLVPVLPDLDLLDGQSEKLLSPPAAGVHFPETATAQDIVYVVLEKLSVKLYHSQLDIHALFRQSVYRPMNLQQALLHRRANLPGRQIEGARFCKCCKLRQKQQMDICTPTQDLEVLGSQVPLMFGFILGLGLIQTVQSLIVLALNIVKGKGPQIFFDVHFQVFLQEPFYLSQFFDFLHSLLIVILFYGLRGYFILKAIKLREAYSGLSQRSAIVKGLYLNQLVILQRDLSNYQIQEKVVLLPRRWFKDHRPSPQQIKELLLKQKEMSLKVTVIVTFQRVSQTLQFFKLFQKSCLKYYCLRAVSFCLDITPIGVKYAPEPFDLIEENLQVSDCDRTIHRVLSATVVLVIFLLGVAILLVVNLLEIGYYLDMVIIVLTNMVLKFAIQRTSSYQSFDSKYSLMNSVSVKTTVLLLINSMIVPVSIILINSKKLRQIQQQILILSLTNLLFPLSQLIEFQNVYKFIRRNTCPRVKDQAEFNQLYESAVFRLQVYYSNVINIFVASACYFFVVPLAALVNLLTLFLVYHVARVKAFWSKACSTRFNRMNRTASIITIILLPVSFLLSRIFRAKLQNREFKLQFDTFNKFALAFLIAIILMEVFKIQERLIKSVFKSSEAQRPYQELLTSYKQYCTVSCNISEQLEALKIADSYPSDI